MPALTQTLETAYDQVTLVIVLGRGGLAARLAVWGLVACLVRHYWPERALQRGIGFLVGTGFSLVGLGWARLVAPGTSRPLPDELLRAVGNGVGVALLLLVVDQMRAMEAQA